MCEFNLGFGMGGLGPFGKDIEDQVGTVQDFAVDYLLDVPELGSRQFIVKNDRIYFVDSYKI